MGKELDKMISEVMSDESIEELEDDLAKGCIEADGVVRRSENQVSCGLPTVGNASIGITLDKEEGSVNVLFDDKLVVVKRDNASIIEV